MGKSLIALGVGLGLLVGCAKKAEVKTVEQLQEAFEPPKTATGTPAQPPEVASMLDTAVSAIKSDDQVAAATSLQMLRSSPNLTVDQYLAVQDMMAQAQVKLAERAARGDQQAIAALKMMQSSMR